MSFLIEGYPALGTAWWVEVSDSLPENQTEQIRALLLTAISDFEARYSRFRPDSLISQLNTNRELNSPDTDFRTLLTYGQELYRRTCGYFNFLIGEVMIARGYDAHYRFTPTVEPTTIPNPLTALHVSEEKITLHTGMVDIGGFGKGYLIDELAKILRQLEVTEFLINGGGDIYGSTLDGAPILIYLEHPTDPETYLGTTTIHNQGFAASSPFKRQWQHAGHTYTHIVGDNSQSFASFVIANNARNADAFATMVLLASEDELTAAMTKEGFGYARFNALTSELARSNFPFSPL